MDLFEYEAKQEFSKLDISIPKGKLITKSTQTAESFQIVIELKKLGTAIKTLTFDECYLEGKSFSMDANGVGLSDYSFTATRLREQ